MFEKGKADRIIEGGQTKEEKGHKESRTSRFDISCAKAYARHSFNCLQHEIQESSGKNQEGFPSVSIFKKIYQASIFCKK